MKYEIRDLGETAEASSGGGARGMRRELLILLALSAVSLFLIWGFFDGLSRLAVLAITPERESRWLGTVVPEMDLWTPTKENDLRRVASLHDSLEKLSKHRDVPELEYRLVILDENEPNAFAIPGGVIGFTRGLIHVLEDNEMAAAFVVAHELGHFANRDHLRGLVRRLGTSATLAVIFGNGGEVVVQSNDLLQLGTSRNQEEAADAFALRILVDTYGHADGADKLFELLADGDQAPEWIHLLSTHPDPKKRLNLIRKAINATR